MADTEATNITELKAIAMRLSRRLDEIKASFSLSQPIVSFHVTLVDIVLNFQNLMYLLFLVVA